MCRTKYLHMCFLHRLDTSENNICFIIRNSEMLWTHTHMSGCAPDIWRHLCIDLWYIIKSIKKWQYHTRSLPSGIKDNLKLIAPNGLNRLKITAWIMATDFDWITQQKALNAFQFFYQTTRVTYWLKNV